MIYRDRKFLSVLTLTEDRDYVTCDELIRVLEERPSDAIYIERDGILRGLVVWGRIMRNCDEKNRRVPFNKKYTYVRPGESLRARQIFKDKATIHMLPVVSADGRLLGEYVRWDDLLGTDYAELLCNDPYVLQSLKEHAQGAVLVKPAAHGGANRDKMFSWWRRKLESIGIYPRVIQHWELKDCFDAAQYCFVVDEDESRGLMALNHGLYHRKVPPRFAIMRYLHRMRQLASGRLNDVILKELQNDGVFILFFDFEENSNQFLASLNEKIRKRNEVYGIRDFRLHESLKESFFDEVYCEAYAAQHFPLGISSHTQSGIPYFSDAETEFVHMKNGERLTVNQPEKFDRCIYLYGACNVTGLYVSDQYTLPSMLQDKMNQAGIPCKVVNRGFPGRSYFNAERLQSKAFKRGDIIVLDRFGSLVEGFPTLNLTDALEKHHAPADWFVDDVRHCNHKANQAYAEAIYEELLPVLRQTPKERTTVELHFDYIDRFYLSHYFSDFDPAGFRTVGSIVMNCNPFTLGHRFLIEEALKAVDFLIIFVVEEDESLFSFHERFAMVCQGTDDLDHIMVVPSGPYILSKNTFPEYFGKIDDEDLKKNTEDDITLFAEKIAPRLGITHRFVGEEREDQVTNEYNEAMRRILPLYGIRMVEIPRKTHGRSAISASRVRRCLLMNRADELDELVPASTKRVLFFEE